MGLPSTAAMGCLGLDASAFWAGDVAAERTDTHNRIATVKGRIITPKYTADTVIPPHKIGPSRCRNSIPKGTQQRIFKQRLLKRTRLQRIIPDVGGDWCQYCHQMDQLFQKHLELGELREKNFITVAVYYGSDKENEQALSRYQKVKCIPH